MTGEATAGNDGARQQLASNRKSRGEDVRIRRFGRVLTPRRVVRKACAHSGRIIGRDMNAMNPNIIIRNETSADVDAITDVTVAAFKTLEISNQTEQFIVAALRGAGALSVSLVAELDGRVVGHIAFSRVTISGGARDWYGLGPVSVLPEHQGQGIGKALVREGVSRLKNLNARGCCLVGHPEYYKKLGFRNLPGLVHPGVPEEVFLAMKFDGAAPQGEVTFHEAFQADGQP